MMTNDLIALFVDVESRLSAVKTSTRNAKTKEDRERVRVLARGLKAQTTKLATELEKS